MVKTIPIAIDKTSCRHFMGYYFRLASRGFLYAPSHSHDGTYHDLCYISCGTLAGTRNSGGFVLVFVFF